MSNDKKQFEKYKNTLTKSPYLPVKFADFQVLKYNDTNKYSKLKREYKLKKHYDKMFEQGYISKLVDFQTYQKIDREISEKLHGIKTVDGIIIKSHSLHFIDRVIGHIFDVPKDKARNGVAIEDIKNTLLNYYEIKETEKSIRITGKRSRLSISKIYVGNLVQVNSYLGEVRK